MANKECIRSVSIVGTGNVAWHMAQALHNARIQIINVFSRSLERAVPIAEQVNAIPANLGEQFENMPDLLLVCSSDDAIEKVLGHFHGFPAVVAHTSGSTGLEVFSSEFKDFGVFYPLQTFTKGIRLNYRDIPFLIEGSSENVTGKLKDLAGSVSDSVYLIDSGTRKQIHIAAVFACNFSNHLANISQHLLKEAGFDFNLLRPLLEETNKKLTSVLPSESQTGPALRRDKAVIKNHLEALSDKPREQELYRLLSESIIKYSFMQNE
ncbi:MAG: DUF2520 domain-containing protein [Bacteroidales bacterium]|nr:DUF2520 domain-containing protein [Bacteroidales bacterium]